MSYRRICGGRGMKYYKTEDVINCVADILAEEANKRGFKPQSPDYFKDKACDVLYDLPTIEVSEEQLSKLQASENSVENTTVSEDFTSISRANSKLEVSEDCISRGNLISDLAGIWDTYTPNNMIDFQDMLEDIDYKIRNAPSVIPNRAEGEWTNAGMLTVHCSNCKSEFHELEAMNYCPNCGARMKGAEE